MPETFDLYGAAIAALLAMGALSLVQLLVADIAGIRAGHVPGKPIGGGHDDFLFRASRAHANTNESLAAFGLIAVAAILLGADPWWTGALAWAFVACRAAHTAAYWADLRILRSAAFALGVLCLLGLLILAARALA